MICLLLVSSAVVRAQQVHIVHSAEERYIFESLDSLSTAKKINSYLDSVRLKGYLSSGIDSISSLGDTTHHYVYIGEKYSVIKIISTNLPDGYLSSNILTINDISVLYESVIKDYENNGYPFAFIRLDSSATFGDTIVTSLFFEPNWFTVYDSLEIYGDCKLSKKYLAKYLGVERGKPYSEKDIRALNARLNNLPLVKVKRQPTVVFYRKLAKVVLFIDDVVTDRFDGVVGFAPNSTNTEENSLLLTGEVNVELNNLFQSGKQLELHWRNYLQRSQMLNVSATLPYIANTRIGVHGSFDLNKFDTLFVNLKSKLSFRYQQKGNNYVQLYYQNTNSNLITADTNQIRSTGRLPVNNPYRIDEYGLEAYTQQLDYLPNPRKGIKVRADISIGQRTLLRNNEIDAVLFNDGNGNFISIYDTLQQRSNLRGNLLIDFTAFVPIRKRTTIKQYVGVRGLISPNILFNELYNFGGYQTLRGFDENDIFASKYLLYTTELRYLIGKNSNIGVFFNAAAVENTIESTNLIYDVPFGFGLSANIDVGNGILNLAYALGKQQNNPIQLSAAKFHFGLINYF
jgi:hypothetical protein